MEHFEGITPDQRWKNEILKEMKELNRLLNLLAEKKEDRRQPGRPKQIKNA